MNEHGVYLDYAGAGVPFPGQLEAVFSELRRHPHLSNPHSRNSSSQLTTELVENARFRVLNFFNTTREHYTVVFTSGATAALKLLAENYDFSPKESFKPENEYLHESTSIAYSDLTRAHVDMCSRPIFAYHLDSHTSVLGMRELVRRRHPQCRIVCVTSHSDVEALLSVRSAHPKLLVYAGQSNFNGCRYPLSWCERAKTAGWHVCLDAAALAASTSLDLQEVPPDFIPISFYKLLGYPTGVGALLVRNESAAALSEPIYFGGGTVQVSLPRQMFHAHKTDLTERLEDGTINYHGVIAVRHGLDAVQRFGGMTSISRHTSALTQYTRNLLVKLRHGTGQPLVKLYGSLDGNDGPVINFNVLRADGTFVGYTEVEKMAELYTLHLRTGCFCNQGACQLHLGLSDANVRQNFKSGKSCGDTVDIIDGHPVGSVRVSLGAHSTADDVRKLAGMLYDCFLTESATTFAELVGRVPAPSELPAAPAATKISTTELQQQSTPQSSVITARITSTSADRGRSRTSTSARCIRLYTDPTTDTRRTSRCRKHPIDFINTNDCGATVAEWLTATLSRDGLRLAEQNNEQHERLESNAVDVAAPISLANVAQFLLVNRSSIQVLLNAIGDPTLTVDELIGRFRPNLVVDCPNPFAEENWQIIAVGDVIFEVVEKCHRCQMICIDQLTGQKNPRILTALRDFRQGQMTFGVYLRMKHAPQGAHLTTGNVVSVVSDAS